MGLYGEPIELGPIRPVAEATSLIIRAMRGCPWSKCKFCTSYKEHKFSLRTVDEIKSDIARANEYYKKFNMKFKSCFIQDGDLMVMSTEDIMEILKELNHYFPELEKITCYARSASLAGKTLEDLKRMKESGLNRIYCGMESGSDLILKMIDKGTSARQLIESGKKVKEAGMELSEFIITGLGGRDYWKENALETARVLNEIKPDFIRIRTVRVKPDSGLEQMEKEGKFQIPLESELIEEQRLLVSNLEEMGSYISNDHASNLLFEAEGSKSNVLKVLDEYLKLPDELKEIYTLGIRFGYFSKLSDLENEDKVKKAIDEFKEKGLFLVKNRNKLFNFLRVLNS